MAGSTSIERSAGWRKRLLAAAGLVLAMLLAGGARAATFELVSVNADGIPGAAESSLASISADGRCVAFASFSVLAPLTPGAGAFQERVYLRDRVARTTELVSVPTSGIAFYSTGSKPAVSADCRFVAFESTDTLVPQDGDFSRDVYVRDRATGTTELVSTFPVSDSLASNAAISADGRRVAFEFNYQVWVRDRRTATLRRVSVPAAGVEASDDGENPSISGDGLRVVFESFSALTDDDDPGRDVFMRDLAAETTLRLSAPGPGGMNDGESFDPFISADGNHVVFKSTSRLVAADDDFETDLYLRDLGSGALELLGGPRPARAFNTSPPTLSGDGRLVAFTSEDRGAAGDDDDATDIYLLDRLGGAVRLVRRPAAGDDSGQGNVFPVLSSDGRHLAFASSGVAAVPLPFQVYAADLELEPSAAADALGTLLIVWQGVDAAGFPAIFGRFYDAETALGEAFQVSDSGLGSAGDDPTIGGPAAEPVVAALSAGRFLVVWVADGDDAILGRSVDHEGGGAPGLGPQRDVSGPFDRLVSGVGSPAVAAAPDGRHVVVWESFALPEGSGRQDIEGALFIATSRFALAIATTVAPEFGPDVAIAADGSFAAVGTFISEPILLPGDTGVISRRFAADGTPGTAVRVNRWRVGKQDTASVAVQPLGGYMVAWQSQNLGPDTGIFARRLPEDQFSPYPEFQVNSQIDGDQRAPAIAAEAGGFAVAWRDAMSGTVKLQRFLASGPFLEGELDLGATTLGFGPPRVVSLPGGRFIVVFGQEDDVSVLEPVPW